VKKGYVAEEQYDQIVAGSAALEASVRADEAAVESAKLDLKYCSIHSPINGVAGEIKVHPGNIIKENENDNPMVIVTQVRPIYVGFSVPETSLTELRRHMATRKLEVVATIPGNETRPVRGDLTFLDNGVDQSTGTILLKGTFPNDDKALWPGQFVQVELTLSSQERAVVVPSQALQAGQEGQFLYLVKPDGTAEYRVVLVSRTLENEAVIEQGVSPGDKVVTDGQLRLAPGVHVKIVDEGEKTGGSPLSK
jgi:multidrug efflux system membrane fusion protein